MGGSTHRSGRPILAVAGEIPLTEQSGQCFLALQPRIKHVEIKMKHWKYERSGMIL
jgi:hypothetical protein